MSVALLAALLVVVLAQPLAAPPARDPIGGEALPGADARRGRPGHHPRERRRRSRRPDPGEVAEWCDRLARSLRAGSSLPAAVRHVEPPSSCRPVATAMVRALDRGAPLRDATVVPTDDPHLAAAISVLHACASLGGPAAEPLDRVAATLRTRAAEAADLRTASAQARWSAHVMTVLPFVVLGSMLLGSATVRAAVASPVGLALVVSGTVLDALGSWWIRRLVDGAHR